MEDLNKNSNPVQKQKFPKGATVSIVVLSLLFGLTAGYVAYDLIYDFERVETVNTVTPSDNKKVSSSEETEEVSDSESTEEDNAPTVETSTNLLVRNDQYYYRIEGDTSLNVWFGQNGATISDDNFVWYSEGVLDPFQLKATLRNDLISVNEELNTFLTLNGFTPVGSIENLTFKGRPAATSDYTYNLYGEEHPAKILVVLGSTGVVENDIAYYITYKAGDPIHESLLNGLSFTR